MNQTIRATYKGKEVILDHCVIIEGVRGDRRYSIVRENKDKKGTLGHRIIIEEVQGNRCYAVVRDKEGKQEMVPIKKLKFLYESTRSNKFD